LHAAHRNVSEAHLLAAWAYETQGNSARALAEYRTAAAVDPDEPTIWRRLAAAAEASGDIATALRAYRELVRLLPTDRAAVDSLHRLERVRDGRQ
jgi:tetratricopeptide (TPR) repeat protein